MIVIKCPVTNIGNAVRNKYAGKFPYYQKILNKFKNCEIENLSILLNKEYWLKSVPLPVKESPLKAHKSNC